MQLGLHQDQAFTRERGARLDLHKVPRVSQVQGSGVEAGGQGKAPATFLVRQEAETITMRCG